MTTEHLFDQQGKVKPKRVAKPEKTADTPQPAKSLQQPLNSATISQVQQAVGNKAVQRLIQRRAVNSNNEVQEETANTIHSARGQGHRLDEGVAAKAGAALGQDFSEVTIHTDSTADQLNKDVGAKAFTTGNDIFFSAGAYSPSTQEGQHLITHELTHVVQQGASVPAVQAKMTVNDPNDHYEAEADKVADQVTSQPDVQRAEGEEDEMAMGKWDIQRAEEEEEMAMGKWDIQRQEEEEDPALMGKWDIQRAEEEEEMAMGKWIQREEAPAEDEEVV